MKKLFVILMLLSPLAADAQSKAVDEFFARYTGAEGYTTMDVRGDMTDLPSGYRKQMEPYAKMLLKGVQRMRIVVAEEYSPGLMLDARKLAETCGIPARHSGTSTSGSERNEAFIYYKKPSGRRPAECLLGVMSRDSKVVIYMTGNFDITSVRTN